MASRPLFLPSITPWPHAEELEIDFQWFPGFAKRQAQRSIEALHEAARARGFDPILEVSSKSPAPEGVALSAFNLMFEPLPGRAMSVECAFQGSKVFESAGPFEDLYDVGSRAARRDPRLRESGHITGFRLLGQSYPARPMTLFYDFVYAQALMQNRHLLDHASLFAGFTDIAFNPRKSLNCQARSLALSVALVRTHRLERAVRSLDAWKSALGLGTARDPGTQGALF